MIYNKISTAAFFLIGMLIGLDVYFDLNEGASLRHVLLEGVVVVTALGLGLLNLRNVISGFERREKVIARNLEALEVDKEQWRQKAQNFIDGFRVSMNAQFDKWQFSEAEKEVALLILKGLSHKEIANIRGTSEKTVRQHGTAIYSKSGTEGKGQFSAFFLEDLKS